MADFEIKQEEEEELKVEEPQATSKPKRKRKARCAKNALVNGNSLLSRVVRGAVSDYMDQLQRENAGTQRLNTPRSRINFKVEDQSTLVVSYTPKGKRKPIEETYPNLVRTKDQVEDQIVSADEAWTAMDLAVYEPGLYWLLYYLYEGKIIATLNRLAPQAKKRAE